MAKKNEKLHLRFGKCMVIDSKLKIAIESTHTLQSSICKRCTI
jgi:hypothetical protein